MKHKETFSRRSFLQGATASTLYLALGAPAVAKASFVPEAQSQHTTQGVKTLKSSIAVVNGNRVITIDGKSYIPAMYRSFRPTPSNVALFHRMGLKLYQMLCSGRKSTLGLPYSNYGEIWKGPKRYDFTAFDRQMAMFNRNAPDGYFIIMIQLDMPEWWMKSHPGVPDSFNNLGEAVFSKEWVEEASDYLKAFIAYSEEKYGDRVFAYSFSAGLATEWFDDARFNGPVSEIKQESYRRWLGDPAAMVPTRKEIYDDSGSVFREPDANTTKYMNYCAGLTPDLICHFAREAQTVIQHQKLVGLFFGYMDCPSGPSDWQNRTSTNGYEKVWQCKDIDMLFSPAAYNECRTLDGVSSYQCLVDSIAVNGKLYLHEIDHRTHLADYPLDNFGSAGEAYKTAYETTMVLRRELCAAMVKDAALWWFDFMGNYYASPELETEIRHQMQILDELHHTPHQSVSEIAVFADPRSFLLVKEQTGLPVDYVRHNRNSLHECGAPYDFYNMNDLPMLDLARYKMFVFLNTFIIPSEIKAFIKDKLKGRMKVWLHAPNIAEDGWLDVQNIEDMVGLKLKQLQTDCEETLCYQGLRFGFGKAVTPMYEVVDEQADILGTYAGSGKTAIAQRGDNVYIAAGNVPYQLWQGLAKRAGVHIYCEKGGALYADSRFVARQTVHETACEIHMPFDAEVEEMFDGGRYRTNHGVLRYNAKAGSTKLFRIIPS